MGGLVIHLYELIIENKCNRKRGVLLINHEGQLQSYDGTYRHFIPMAKHINR